MHRAKIRIPQSKPQFDVCVIGLYRSKKDSGPFAYLQNFRHEWLKILGKDREETEKARTYKRKVDPEYVPMLVNAIEGPVDAVLSPPSDHPWQAEPYRMNLADKFPDAADLTERFSRNGSARAAKGATLDELTAGLVYEPNGHESEFRALVIVDDTFRTGTTAAAIIAKLEEHGPAEECRVIIAAPLWTDT
jgi:hypothetical protein